ncbi:glycoside hydrolase family 88 protein [Sphaerisporangium corydalis]|uniref:Glycoside hydrolase family 88 protein n=1 Tax=Sphaerisporangium corydalis TaxID=1441875 RepID=A0ABV9EQL0_9ACTN|nr:glycoside hydrolase family 88 protein [Sphaerisporangium corydalis]
MAERIGRSSVPDPRSARPLVPGPGPGRRRVLFGLLGAAAVPLYARGASAAIVPSSTLPARADILAAMRRVNDQWIGAHTNPGDAQWARATYFSGVMAAYRATGEARYLAYAKKWAEQNGYALNGGVGTRHADNHTAGQVYYDLNDVTPDPAKVTAINESLRLMVYGAQSTKIDDWTWVDALHMAMPVFARVAAYRNDDAYRTRLWAMYTYCKKTLKLYDYGHELWYRDRAFVPGGAESVSPNGRPVFWSRGNGWAIAAHAKTLGLLGATATRWPEYTYNIQGLGRSLLATQRSDGFWNVNLGDAAHLPGPETSGTAMFAFGLAYAVRTGIVDRATYLPVAARAWNGMLATAVRADGFLGYVQGVGYKPESSQPVTAGTTADFGVGAFLLAGAELAKLAT